MGVWVGKWLKMLSRELVEYISGVQGEDGK